MKINNEVKLDYLSPVKLSVPHGDLDYIYKYPESEDNLLGIGGFDWL